MAVNFGNNISNRYSATSSIISASDPRPVTVMCKFKATARGQRHTIFCNNASSAPRFYVEIFFSGANDFLRLYSNGFVQGSNFTLSTSAVTSLGWTWAADNSVAFFVNGAASGTTTKTVAGTGTAGSRIAGLGLAIAGFTNNGDQSELAVWSAVLPLANHAEYHAGVSPKLIRPDVLEMHAPLVDNPTSFEDLVGSVTYTKVGTVTKAPHAPMFYPSRPHIITAPAAAPPAGTILPHMMHMAA